MKVAIGFSFVVSNLLESLVCRRKQIPLAQECGEDEHLAQKKKCNWFLFNADHTSLNKRVFVPIVKKNS